MGQKLCMNRPGTRRELGEKPMQNFVGVKGEEIRPAEPSMPVLLFRGFTWWVGFI